MQAALIPLTQQFSVVIAAYYNGELHQHATGTLVQFGDHCFVATAAHAIDDFHQAKEHYPDLRLFVDNGVSNDLVPLDGNYFATKTVYDRETLAIRLPGERNDLWDVALWELGSRSIQKLTNKAFLNRSSIDIGANLSTGVFFLAGCPRCWSQVDYATRSFSWTWLTYLAQPYAKPESLAHFDERFHMALRLADDAQLPTDLKGISGCAIWKVADYPIRDDWSVEQARVVAIQTCVLKETPKAIRGTKWACVLPVLARMHPDIREIFRLWLP
jgi:hypothetical protein